ncbi:hypothetical protein WJX73_002067 [Symbiochloris irregularis]|uniref:CBM20 domain-containing protein n=1 Tax=Symbiochloris irregularis TaxID=706552 RepID=A0AAW1NMM3_9CHLO
MALCAMRGARCAGYCSPASEQATPNHVRLSPCTAQSSLDRLRTGAANTAERRPAGGNGILFAQRRELLHSRRQDGRRAAQRCRSAAVDSETSEATSVELVVEDLQLPFGQGVKAVGGAEQLGSWSVESAPALEWQEGHSWVGTLQLQPGEHKFKLVKFAQEGSPWEEWEDGYDRVMQVPGSNGQGLKWICRFSNTAETLIGDKSAAASNGAGGDDQHISAADDESSGSHAEDSNAAEEEPPAAEAELGDTEDFTAWSSGNDDEEQQQEEPMPSESMPEAEPEPEPVAVAQPARAEAPVPIAVQGEQEIMYDNVKATIEADGTTTYEFPDDDDYE